MPHRAGRLATAVLILLAAHAPSVALARDARAAVVSLALWSDPVFRSEASGAAAVLASRFGHGGPVIVKANTPSRLGAAPGPMAAALAAASRRLDPDTDVLFLVLTSHGSPEGIAEKGAGRTGLLTPEALADMLARTPVRRKVLIVSACFAGLYTSLAGPDTLVITAADATHTSFGCVPEAKWTYFGDAFFNVALRHGGSIPRAFEEAKRIVTEREMREGFTPSNPQIAGGDEVLEALQ